MIGGQYCSLRQVVSLSRPQAFTFLKVGWHEDTVDFLGTLLDLLYRKRW